MRRLGPSLGLVGLAALLACSGGDGQQIATPRIAPPTNLQMAETLDDAPGEAEVYRYNPEGKQDPFRSFVRVTLMNDAGTLSSPLERFDLSQLAVTGIIWGPKNPRALVMDPAGKGYIVGVGTLIGKNNGKVVRIEDNRILVKETDVDFRDRATTSEVELLLYVSQGG